MSLARHQRSVRDLLVDGGGAVGDPYALAASRSEAAGLLRDIAASWRRLGLERTCPLTVGALRQQGGLDRALADHGRRAGHSPFLEVLAQQFLAVAVVHQDPLVAAVARFELAVHRARTGAAHDGDTVDITWPCPPLEALQAIVDGRPAPSPSGSWRTTAPAREPHHLVVEGSAGTA